MKEEALKLADQLENDGDDFYRFMASAMIRRLVEELDALNAKESMWQEMIEDLECQVIKYKQGEPFHDFNTLTLDTGEKRSLKPLSEYAQYDRGFDDGVKHGKEIYEAEIVELKAQTKPLKLSYEQINQVASRFSLNGFSYIDFAEAILEEASK